VQLPKLALAGKFPGITPVNVREQDLVTVVREATDGWGADIVFEATGNEQAIRNVFDSLCPGGCVVLIGMPGAPVLLDVVAAQVKEARLETIFRYAHVYPRALALMGAGKINVKPLLTDRFPFAKSVEAFEFAAHMPPSSVKVQIDLPV
jgi:D-xylulose reductase